MSNNKPTLWLRALAISLFCGTVFGACKSDVNNTPAPSTIALSIEDALLQPDDFSKEYNWISDSGGSNVITMTVRVPLPSREAFRVYAGIYGSEKYYVKLIHRVLQFDDQVPAPEISDPKKLGFSQPDNYVPVLKPVGVAASAICTKGKGDLRSESLPMLCQVEVSYQHTISNLMIWVPTALDGDPVTQIINDLLEKIDKRMRRFESN